MDDNISSSILIVFISIIVGMSIGILIIPKEKYHGPNAMSFCKNIYHSRKMNKYYKFGIKPLNC